MTHFVVVLKLEAWWEEDDHKRQGRFLKRKCFLSYFSIKNIRFEME
jgi:hypothetical protein